MATLKIDIVCGTTTCASGPGKFCRFFGSRQWGTIPTCTLFPTPDGAYTDLEVHKGWTQRCAECMRSEVDEHDYSS